MEASLDWFFNIYASPWGSAYHIGKRLSYREVILSQIGFLNGSAHKTAEPLEESNLMGGLSEIN